MLDQQPFEEEEEELIEQGPAQEEETEVLEPIPEPEVTYESSPSEDLVGEPVEPVTE